MRNPDLKILVSVGGWTWSKNFSDTSLTKESRKIFIDSAVDFVTKYDLDGLDIDYEHPNDPKDVSSNKSVHNYLEAGVKPNKIILGVPFYGNWLVQRLGGMMFWE